MKIDSADPAMQRMAEVLRLLASPWETQVLALPTGVVVPDELALLFDDEYRRLGGEGGIVGAPPHFLDILGLMNGEFEAMSDVEWTNGALVSSPRWSRVRELALAAQEVIGVAPGPPVIDWVRFVTKS